MKITLSVSSCHQNLRTDTEAEGHGIYTDIQQSPHGSSPQSDFTDMAQESRIGHINHILCKQT